MYSRRPILSWEGIYGRSKTIPYGTGSISLKDFAKESQELAVLASPKTHTSRIITTWYDTEVRWCEQTDD